MLYDYCYTIGGKLIDGFGFGFGFRFKRQIQLSIDIHFENEVDTLVNFSFWISFTGNWWIVTTVSELANTIPLH